MARAPVPDWIEVRPGSAALVLLAPHGGRRTAPRHPGRDKVNDLHTADLTRELAAACDATSVINSHQDRNALDLNRIVAVRDRAPWLLTLLGDTLERMVARAGHATVVVVHGWNVMQSACDLGIGLVKRDGRCGPAGDGRPTVSERFLRETLRPLQRRAADVDVTITIGARYPAAHPNNLLQLFTDARVTDGDAALARIAALAEQIEAVQLELGIPLRWPGTRRRAFMELLAATLATVGGTRRTPSAVDADLSPAAATAVRCGGRMTRRHALQFVAGDLLGMTSMEIGEHGAVAGRLLLSPGPDRLALFTGELADAGGLQVPPLAYQDRGAGAFDVAYDGPLLLFPTLTPFLDLESGLARGELVEASVALQFEPEARPVDHADAGATAGTLFGTLRGRVTLDRHRHDIEAVACMTAAPLPGRSPALPSLRLTLPATPLGHLDLKSRAVHASEEPQSDGAERAPAPRTTDEERARTHGPTSDDVRAVAKERGLAFDLGGTTSDGSPVTGRCEVVLSAHGGTVRIGFRSVGTEVARDGVVERIVPVRRPGRAGSVVETRYALCRFSDLATGWLELSVEDRRGV